MKLFQRFMSSPPATQIVGHLAASHNEAGFLVYDYAVGGHTVDDVADQVRQGFLTNEGGKTKKAIKWGAADSLFVTWVGFNDVADADLDENGSRNRPSDS
ncbi:hypothetical protein FRB99_005292 [Tulasnella sp. 403]|nr:hypothetical protein FRB99_005292 [Tulasnella sp. 403]